MIETKTEIELELKILPYSPFIVWIDKVFNIDFTFEYFFLAVGLYVGLLCVFRKGYLKVS